MGLSIITPVYNEKKTILEILRRLKAVNFLSNMKLLLLMMLPDGTTKILKFEIQSVKSKTNFKSQAPGSKIKVFF